MTHMSPAAEAFASVPITCSHARNIIDLNPCGSESEKTTVWLQERIDKLIQNVTFLDHQQLADHEPVTRLLDDVAPIIETMAVPGRMTMGQVRRGLPSLEFQFYGTCAASLLQ